MNKFKLKKIKNDINKEKIDKFKKEKGCVKCGIKHSYLLTFHHLDPKIKKFNISNFKFLKWDDLLKEIKKCIVLCLNCHQEFHHLEKTEKKTIEEFLKK